MSRTPRPAARIILADGAGRTLLFRFTVDGRAPFWVTPGGALDPGESYPAAARRELREETGLDADPGPEVARRVVDFVSVEGVPVTADERYFRVDVETLDVEPAGHTELERRVMRSWRWFTPAELATWPEAIYPADLSAMIAATNRSFSVTDLQRVSLSTGVELDVAVAGPRDAPPVILLHGFPESHRTWRGVMPDLARDHFVLAPDQRGYARSSKPEGVEAYSVDRIVADVAALADAFGIDRFTLVGHDWGGAAAWAAALTRPDRVARLVIVNAPHPLLFQRSLYDDLGQREASQYIRHFRDTSLDERLAGPGLERFADTTFARHVEGGLSAQDRAAYLDEWGQPGAITAMLNWYRASNIVVPATDERPKRPAYLDRPFPPVTQPTLVVWGTRDAALLPVQLDGLDAHVPDLAVERVDAGHFVPWQNAPAVVAAFRRWEAGQSR